MNMLEFISTPKAGVAICSSGATCGSFAPPKWLSGFHKIWYFNLHLIDIRIKLIAIQRVLL